MRSAKPGNHLKLLIFFFCVCVSFNNNTSRCSLGFFNAVLICMETVAMETVGRVTDDLVKQID